MLMVSCWVGRVAAAGRSRHKCTVTRCLAHMSGVCFRVCEESTHGCTRDPNVAAWGTESPGWAKSWDRGQFQTSGLVSLIPTLAVMNRRRRRVTSDTEV
jgi:hypothetical protein